MCQEILPLLTCWTYAEAALGTCATPTVAAESRLHVYYGMSEVTPQFHLAAAPDGEQNTANLHMYCCLALSEKGLALEAAPEGSLDKDGSMMACSQALSCTPAAPRCLYPSAGLPVLSHLQQTRHCVLDDVDLIAWIEPGYHQVRLVWDQSRQLPAINTLHTTLCICPLVAC